MTDGGSKLSLVGDWVLTTITGNSENYICTFAWDWITGDVIYVRGSDKYD